MTAEEEEEERLERAYGVRPLSPRSVVRVFSHKLGEAMIKRVTALN